jgi:hypothetical protein
MAKKLLDTIIKRRTTAELVVKPRLPPHLKLLLAGSILTSVVLGGAWLYNYGLSAAGFERAFAAQEQERLAAQLERQRRDNEALREELARAQRSVQMSETAFQELDRALKASAAEIVKLREELNFYRNIISPLDKKAGLRIQNLHVRPTGAANTYRYKLVLIQALKHDKAVRGVASLEVTGLKDGEETALAVTDDKDGAIRVNFKYFQDIEGEFELPPGFKPQRIRVSIKPRGGEPVEASYAWPQA